MDDEEFESLGDMPVDKPAGYIRVEMPIPQPTLEQIAGEMARMVLRESNFDRPSLRSLAMDRLYAVIDSAVAERVRAVVEELLERPMQRTDGYGAPVGEPVSMASVIRARVESWATELVDLHGKPKSAGSYSGEYRTRLEATIAELARSDMATAIGKEVEKVKADLKEGAKAAIARQIADRISGMVLK